MKYFERILVRNVWTKFDFLLLFNEAGCHGFLINIIREFRKTFEFKWIFRSLIPSLFVFSLRSLTWFRFATSNMRHILKLIGWLFGGHHANWISFGVIWRTLYNVMMNDWFLRWFCFFSVTKKYNLISKSLKSFECMMTFYFMKMAHFSVTMFKFLETFMSCILRMDSYHNHSWSLLISLKNIFISNALTLTFPEMYFQFSCKSNDPFNLVWDFIN